MNKAVVIPYHIYNQMKTEEQKPTNLKPDHNKLYRLEDELKDILNRTMPINEKRILYHQVLQNYLKTYDDVARQTYQIEQNVKENDNSLEQESKSEHSQPLIKVIRGVFPKTYHEKIDNLYKSLKSVEGLDWDDRGKIQIDGVDVVNTNITDIVVDLMKKWKREPPSGWDRIRSKLQQSNFPTSLIYNPARITDLTSRNTPTPDQVDEGSDYESPEFLTTRKRIRKSPYSVSGGKKNIKRWLRF